MSDDTSLGVLESLIAEADGLEWVGLHWEKTPGIEDTDARARIRRAIQDSGRMND